MERLRHEATALACLLAAGLAFGQTAAPSTRPAMPPAGAGGGATTMPATMPTSMPGMPTTMSIRSGSIAVQAIQGTKGGPSVAGDDVIVELFGRTGQRLHKAEAKLDEHGVAIVENLPLMPPSQPRVTVKRGGAFYQSLGEPMDLMRRHQKIEVTVYEVTHEEPAWDIPMMHVLLRPAPRGLLVSEMIVASNPTDRAWLRAADANGLQSSLAVELPFGAAHVQMGGGFHPSCAETIAGRLVSTAALPPGTSRYRVDYVLPSREGQAYVEFSAPAAIRNLVVLLPRDGPQFRCDSGGLMAAGEVGVHQEPMRSYRAADVPAGQRIAFAIGGLGHLTGTGKPAGDDESLSTPELFAIVGAAVLAVLCVAIFLIRPRRRPQAEGPSEANTDEEQ